MSMEPRVVRTLKRDQDRDNIEVDGGSILLKEAERRKSFSDEILDIIYNKVMLKHQRESMEQDAALTKPGSVDIGRGISALIKED